MKKIDNKAKLIHLFESLNGVKLDHETVKPLIREGIEDLNTTVDNPTIVRDIPDSPFAQEPNISINPDGAGNPNPSLPENEIDKLNNYVQKEVRFLKVGDVLYSSGAKVIKAPEAGLNTPTGKVEVMVEYPNGRKTVQLWGKYTRVPVRPLEKGMGLGEEQINTGDGDSEPMNNYAPPVGLGSGLGESEKPQPQICPYPKFDMNEFKRLAGMKEEQETGNDDYNEGTPTNPDNDITEPKPRI